MRKGVQQSFSLLELDLLYFMAKNYNKIPAGKRKYNKYVDLRHHRQELWSARPDDD